jgi:rod shape-determining protein MreD
MSLLLLLDKSLRSSVPKLVAVMIVLVSIQPISLPGIAAFMPMLEVICIYYWGNHAPQLFPAWFVLLLGLLQDILYGTPLGMTALSNLFLFAAVLSQRRFLMREPFWVQWCGFLLFSFGIVVVKWLLAALLLPEVKLQGVMAMQWLFTALLYPLAHSMFDRIYRVVVSGNRYAQ